MNFLKNNKIIIIILLLSFFLSLGYSFYFKIKPAVDAQGYDIIAANIAAGNGYRSSLNVPLAEDWAIMRVGPLYEYFLAGIYYVFGHSYGWVWLAQALLHAVSAWLIYLTCLLVFKDREKKKIIGLLAAGIFGFYPDLIEISAMLMTETFYLFLFCLAIYLFFRYFYRPGVWSALVLGLVFALATLARPPVLFLVPIVLFYYCKEKRIWLGILFIMTMLAVFTPWTVRNYRVYDKLMPFSTAGAYNFWIGNYHGGNGEQEPTAEMKNYAHEQGISAIPAEATRQFKNFLFHYPGEFIKLTALRINKYFSVIRPMGFWFYQSGWGQFAFIMSSAAASVIIFIFGLAGLIKSWAAEDTVRRYLLAFIIITPLIVLVTVVETRYRFQIYPLLAIFAAYFMVYLWQEKKWRDQALWFSVAIILANGLLDLILSWDKFQDRLGTFF